jgi:hypothetical protein
LKIDCFKDEKGDVKITLRWILGKYGVRMGSVWN